MEVDVVFVVVDTGPHEPFEMNMDDKRGEGGWTKMPKFVCKFSVSNTVVDIQKKFMFQYIPHSLYLACLLNGSRSHFY